MGTTEEGHRLDIESLRHPSEPSRFALAVIASAVVVAGAVFVLVAIGRASELYGYVAGLVVFLFVSWLALQLWRVRLLADSVKVTADTLPEVDTALRSVCERLGYDKRVDVFVVDKVARVLGQNGPSITLTSFFSVRVILAEASVLGDLDDAQHRSKLEFLLATYVGALKARQAQWTPVLTALQFTGLTKLAAVFIYPWLRATVYTGDRIAYAMCDDLDISVHAVYETLVGRDIATRLRNEGLVNQAITVRRNAILRIAQLLRPVPHASNRYLQLLVFARQRSADTFDPFRGQLASPALERAPEVLYPHLRRGNSWLVPVAAFGACAILISGFFLGVSAQRSTAWRALGVEPTEGPSESEPEPKPTPTGPEPSPIEPVPLGPDVIDASRWAPASVDGSGTTVTFEPLNAADDDRSTAWRVPGDGLADWITFAWDQPVTVTALGLVPGYHKVDPVDLSDRFIQNRRVVSAGVYVNETTSLGTLELEDSRAMQTFELDAPVEASALTIEITETTPHGGRDFTAISEITVWGTP